MDKTPFDLQLLVIFVAVVEQTSFSKAAARLGVGKATVSRSIAQLEELLGVELLHRTTHHVALSTAGTVLYERTQQHLSALKAAVADLPERDEEPSGLLRMTVPPDFGAIVLPSVLAAFSRRHPAVHFDVRVTSTSVNLVSEGYDLAIRVATGALKDSTLTARRIGRTSAGFFAAPSYLSRRGRPRQLGEDKHCWIVHPGVLRLTKVSRAHIQFVVDDFLLTRDLIAGGVGIGLLPSFVARGYLREGLMEEVPLAAPLPASQMVMLYPTSGQTPRKVTAFRDFLIEAMKSGAA